MMNEALFKDLMAHYDPDKQPIQEFKILNALVQDSTSACSAIAVHQILDLTNRHLAASHGIWPVNTMKGELPWNVSSLVMEIATYTPSARQTKLLEFIIQLQKAVVVDPTTGQDVRYEGERVWNGFPTLATYISDFWAFRHDNPHPPCKILEWENKTSFLAKITASSPVTYTSTETAVHPLDYSHYGLYACSEAFEDPDSVSVSSQYETQVRTACIWLLHAGYRLYQNCEHSRPLQLFEEGPLSVRVRGFDQLRWRVWKEGLVVAQTVWRNPSTRDLIWRALGEIDRVE